MTYFQFCMQASIYYNTKIGRPLTWLPVLRILCQDPRLTLQDNNYRIHTLLTFGGFKG